MPADTGPSIKVETPAGDDLVGTVAHQSSFGRGNPASTQRAAAAAVSR